MTELSSRKEKDKDEKELEAINQARVAAFSIQGEGALSKTIEVGITPEAYQVVNIVIHNKSGVAVEYMVKVAKMTNNLPLTLKLEKSEASPDPTFIENYTAFKAQQVFDPNVKQGDTYNGTMEGQKHTYGLKANLTTNAYKYKGHFRRRGWRMIIFLMLQTHHRRFLRMVSPTTRTSTRRASRKKGLMMNRRQRSLLNIP